MKNLLLSFYDLALNQQRILNNLLLGNGFSINFSSKFQYSSLKDECEPYFSEEEKKLFDKLNTTNFESIMYGLYYCDQINEIYNISNPKIKESYEKLKHVLIQGVRKVHISYDEYQLTFFKQDFGKDLFGIIKHNIFTTNYDLLPYWIIMDMNSSDIGDLFSREQDFLYFNEGNARRVKLLYLHGALHLYMEDGYVKKIHRQGDRSLLDLVTDLIQSGTFPLFLSEGIWSEKLKKIRGNVYLRYCYQQLLNASGGLTIFGHDLSEHGDWHIIDAINQSNLNPIAYGIYLDAYQHEREVNEKIARINKLFINKEVSVK